MKRLLSSIVIISLLIAIVILPIKANPSVAENDLSITKTLDFQSEDSDKTAENRLEKFALFPKLKKLMLIAIFSLFLLSVMLLCSGYRKPYRNTIDAEKDAFLHNNVGLNYLKDRIYYAAIQEFKIAIQLSPNTQATAIFKNNLGDTYTYIGYPDMARICYEDAIKLYGLNFKYYLNLLQGMIKRTK